MFVAAFCSIFSGTTMPAASASRRAMTIVAVVKEVLHSGLRPRIQKS
jgi:hypothetical protein